MSSPSLTTRFAPSPTGHLHLGNARTALLNQLAARKTGGRFMLRVEDTDAERSSDAFMAALFEDLRWLGLQWDEGPDVGGPHIPYRQQQRRDIYDTWLKKLADAGWTYPCFCTPAELSLARKRQLAAGKPPRYLGTCRELSVAQHAERAAGSVQAAQRFRVPAGQTICFRDVVHGEQRFSTDDIGDFIIGRTDGSTAFFFSNAIDDALMGVTLVLRGDDHLANTPRQLLILQALELSPPTYAHVALLLGADGAPLSKRHGALSLRELRALGFLPSAIRNHLVRLGHTYATDGWLDETAMRTGFDLQRLGRAAARFDETQLLHWQKEAVAHLTLEAFHRWVENQLPPELDSGQFAKFAAAVRPNVVFPPDVERWANVVFRMLPDYATDATAAIREAGQSFFAVASEVFARSDEVRQSLREVGKVTMRKGPALYLPLRAALTGATHGPELAPLLALIPAAAIGARLSHAHDLAGS